MNNSIKAKVVMPLSRHINGGYKILKNDIDGALTTYKNEPFSREEQPQHLYFTTDEPIQEGDWCFAGMGYYLIKALNIYDFKFHYKNCTKIVASTDPALGLPTIPTTWIKDGYVPSNGSIKQIELETFLWDFVNQDDGVVETTDKLKLTDNNEVVIVGRPIEKNEDNIPKEFILSQYDAKEWVDSIKPAERVRCIKPSEPVPSVPVVLMQSSGIYPNYQENYTRKCSHTYSKAMNQQYPRLCVKCGTPEFEVTKMTWDEIRDSIKLPNNISYLDLHHIIEILKDDFNPPIKKLRI